MRKMGIGLGVGINRSNYAQGIFNAYSARVVADGGVVESGSCVDAVSSLLQSASLLLIPSGYKGGKLYSEIPTNGNGDLTWTRASDAWRTNADGLIQRVPWNLVQYSQEFDNAYWTKNVGATITVNTTTAPDGTTTADTLNVIASTFSGIYRAISGVSANYTLSIYAKKNTKSWIYLFDVTGSVAKAWFNLDSGVLGTVASGYTATIIDVGNGWYRCTLSNNNTLTASYYQFGLSDANNSTTPTSSGSAFIWGAQLVEGTTAQTYLPTTDRLNFPRLSYMYGSCPAVLLEPQRTNLALYSDQFNDASWLKNNTTITANQETSPDGTQNADLLSASIGATAFLYRSFTLTAGTSYTFSIYVKKKTVTSSSNRFRINFVNNLFVDFSGSVPVITSGSGSIQNAANGFYRIITTVTTSVASNVLYIYPDGNNGSADEYYIYGAQLEAGAYPTTYIPTTSATATRIADSFSRSNIYTNGLISASGGTWFVELRNNIVYTRDSVMYFGVGDTNTLNTNSIFFNPGTTSRLALRKNVASVLSTIYQTTTDTCKLAIKWNGTIFEVFENGVKVVSSNSFTITNMEFLIGNASAVPYFIQQMALYPTPLSDTDCQTLTTL